uniref:G-protein coupled receptors family 2 profile 2 domain-containing protein n=1 Tax=Ditylenchus dipsaci TaxID=166011 RepID=A0A915CXH5_9BILA
MLLFKSDIDLPQFFYNLMLSLFYLFFFVFSDQGRLGSDLACKVTAGITYWLLLTCILLSIFQALRILKIFVWTVTLERIAIFLTSPATIYITSFCAPTLVCSTLAVFISDFFSRNDEFCWIRPDYVWFAVVLPLTLLIVNGVISLIIISIRLFPNLFGFQKVLRTGSKIMAKGTKKQTKEKLIAIFLLQFILGMPWIFMYATLFAPQVTMWHYLFTIVNSSQGIVLFLLFVHKQIQLHRRQANNTQTSSWR